MVSSKPKTRRWFALAFTVVLVFASAGMGQAAAEEGGAPPVQNAAVPLADQAIHFVVDVSGSMSGVPIAQVKEALTLAVPQLPAETLVGMRSFGVTGCDSALNVPIGPLDAAAFQAQVDGLGAWGSTPLALGLERAGEDIRNAPAVEKTIILLNDGDNNCGGDPCQVASDLVASGVDVTVHTVGIQLSPGSAAAQTLECIAQVTGGTYVPLDDPADLSDVLPDLTTGGQLDYVALGDSYSSGEGTFSYGPTAADQRCHRGALAWPDVMDDLSRSGSGEQLAPVENRACSGAVTTDLFRNYRQAGKQVLPSTPDPTVDLVTMTLGGNDMGFESILRQCVAWTCAGMENSTQFTQDLAALQRRLERSVYPDLRRAFPNARIVHVGYPRLTPRSGNNCAWLSNGEAQSADQMVRRVNTTLRSAALRSGTSGVEYVDVYDALAGNELCTANSHVNALTLWGDDERGHPTEVGQQRIAAMVLDRLDL